MDTCFNIGKRIIGIYQSPSVREPPCQLMQQIYELARRPRLESLDADCLENSAPIYAG